jgi:hypothetical protein
LTKDNNLRSLVPLAAMLCAAVIAAADLPTNEITSNNVIGLAGNGDTLWMATDQGLNYTLATSDTLSWHGYKAQHRVVSLAFGAGTAVAAFDTTSFLSPNMLWFYSHSGRSFDSLQLPFGRTSMSVSELQDSAVFMATSVVFSPADNSFWCACQDGGLVRFNPVSKTLRAFYPRLGRSFDPASVRIDSVTGIKTVSDLVSKRVIGVAVQKTAGGSPAVCVLTRDTLYRLFPADTSWDALPSKLDGSKVLDKFNTVFAGSRSFSVFASISPKGYEEPKLFRYDSSAGAWTGFDSLVTGLTNGPDSTTYLTINYDYRSIRKFSGNAFTAPSPNSFATRITQAMGNLNPESINDILYLPRNDTSGSLWIATSSVQSSTLNGLFFSRFEEQDEQDSTPFVYVRRDRKINTGLKETYAVPGILSSGASGAPVASQAVFAYSLSKGSNVTISVYDWNMNLVKIVTSNKWRPAGKDDLTGNGRSTDRKEDVWDGTNSAGKRVAVGVYYFRITATGERSFGKIIVAK